jgi:hypothetical protein
MGCPKCEDHKAHEVILAQHEKRHDAHDSAIIDIWEAIKLKVSRWIFVILLGIVISSFGFQMTTLNVVQKIDKNVAVLSERLQNHMGSSSKKNTVYIP